MLLLIVCKTSNQAILSIPIPLKFQGEYSLDNGNSWNTLTDSTKISATDENLILRGNFGFEVPEGIIFNFYLNHITMEIFVNGEQSFFDSRTETGLMPSNCCRQWLEWVTPELSENDILEIHLANPHSFGNKNAYNELLSSIYAGDSFTFNSYISQYGKPYRIIGIAVIIISLMLFSVAAASWLLRIEIGNILGKLCFLSFFTGGYFTLNTIDLSLWSHLNAFNTYGLQICIMLASFGVVICVNESLKTKAHKISEIAAGISTLTNVVLLTLSLIGVKVIYDTNIYWFAVHIPVFLTLLGCCIYELCCSSKKNYIVMCSYIVLITAILLDMLSFITEWLPSGICSKAVFIPLFLLHLFRMIKVVPVNYRKARQSEEMAAELQNNRISILLSQIQPHFMSNSLTSIAMLCEKNPLKAQKAIINLAEYLRENMNSLKEQGAVPFTEELEHTKHYLYLEELRFGDLLEVIYDIETTDFKIPALTIQPLVENAVKHGIKSGKGKIVISVKENPENYVIKVMDNGSGFDISNQNEQSCQENHTGIENVRQRLKILSGASLEIESIKAEGTTVKVILPKENVYENYGSR